MSAGDFWRRVGFENVGEAGGLPSLGTNLLEAAITDLALGAGGLSANDAIAVMDLAAGDEQQEFTDLRLSAASINGANAFQTTQLRIQLCHGITSAAFLSQNSDANVPENPYYHNGEAVRLRAKELVIALGGTPVGTLAA